MCVAKADEFDSFCLLLVQLPTYWGGGEGVLREKLGVHTVHT